MKIRGQIIFSENINSGENGNTITNPILSIAVPGVPSLASLGVTIVSYIEKPIKVINIELKIYHKESNETMFKIENTLIDLPNESIDTNFVLNADLRNIRIPQKGTYVAECIVEGISFTQELEVVLNG